MKEKRCLRGSTFYLLYRTLYLLYHVLLVVGITVVVVGLHVRFTIILIVFWHFYGSGKLLVVVATGGSIG